jgi:diguanylate cyclase (GGDEF)-like protein/PAS domain S-box-containing protein
MLSVTPSLHDAAAGDEAIATPHHDRTTFRAAVDNHLYSEYTRLCESRDELVALKEQYRYMLDAAPVAYITTDANGVIVHANQRALLMLGLEANEMIGMPTVHLADARYRHALMSHLGQVDRIGESEIELDLRTGHDGRLPALLRSIPIAFGVEQKAAVQSAIIDISALKQAEDRLRRARDELQVLANHDTLTGLPNRSLFLDRLGNTIRQACSSGRQSALLFLDMDRFKVINDSLGHDVGDSLLQHVAHTLTDTVRTDDTVARMGGDEFTVILSDVGDTDNAIGIAQKLLNAINQPVTLCEHRFRPSSSIGVCMLNGSVHSERELMRFADKAMYTAKNLGGNGIHLYDPTEQDDGRSTLERDLHCALERGQLRVLFQPQYCGSGEIVAHEALLRWTHPTLGPVSPSQFIPIAEQSNLIGELGAWVLREACRQNMAHASTTGRVTRIAVNVSPRELASADYAERVEHILRETGHPPEALELEITESSMGLADGTLEETLETLTASGVSIALDDFGTGYSSFTRLRQLPITRLKVDRTFTHALSGSDGDRRIVAAIVSLGKELGLEVVAEGVETEYQLSFLRNSGCNVFQGFVFSRPRQCMAVA